MIECLMTWLKRVFGAGDNVAPLLFAFFPFDPDPVHIIHEVSVVLKDRYRVVNWDVCTKKCSIVFDLFGMWNLFFLVKRACLYFYNVESWYLYACLINVVYFFVWPVRNNIMIIQKKYFMDILPWVITIISLNNNYIMTIH